MSKMGTSTFVFALLFLLGGGAVAAAQSDEELARQFFSTGRAYFDRAEYEKAAEAFAEAYALSGRPALLVNQARALEALRRYEEAIALLERALADLPESETELRESVEGRLRRLRIDEQRDEERASSSEAASEASSAEPAPPEAEGRPGRGALFLTGAGLTALGGASLVVALATGIASRGINSDLDAACPGGVCDPRHAGEIERGKSLAVASTVTLSIGAAASIAGVLLMVLPKRDRESEPRLSLTGGPGEIGAGLRLRF